MTIGTTAAELYRCERSRELAGNSSSGLEGSGGRVQECENSRAGYELYGTHKPSTKAGRASAESLLAIRILSKRIPVSFSVDVLSVGRRHEHEL